MEAKREAVPKASIEEIPVPEWEHEKAYTSQRAPRYTGVSILPRIRAKYRTTITSGFAQRRVCGIKRWLLILIVSLVLLVCVIAIVVGAVVGTRRKQQSSTITIPADWTTVTGDLTYYGTGLGACGFDSGDNDHIVAVSHLLFDAAGSSTSTGGNSNANPLCGRIIRASRFDTAVGQQRTFDLTVVDRCTGCKEYDLDTSLGVFEQMASQEQGRVNVSWAWLPAGSTS